MAEKMNKANKKDTGIDPNVLESLVRQYEASKEDMDESRGEIGALVKRAEDEHSVNLKAFKLTISVRKMSESARADFLRAFDDYREKLNLNAQGDLFDDREADDTEAQAAGDATGEANAEAIREGIKPTGGRKRGASASAVH